MAMQESCCPFVCCAEWHMRHGMEYHGMHGPQHISAHLCPILLGLVPRVVQDRPREAIRRATEAMEQLRQALESCIVLANLYYLILSVFQLTYNILQHLTTSYRFQTAIGCNRALGLLRSLVLRQIGDLKGEAKARQPCIGTRCHNRCMPLISSNGFCGMFVGCTQWRLPISLLSCSARPGPERLNHITYRTYTDIAYKSAAQLENIPMSYQSVTHFRLCGMQGKEDYGCQTVCKGCALMTTWKPPPRRRRRCCCCCMFVHAFMLMDRLQVLAESFMWHRYLESILFGLSSWSHRPAPGIAEWVLFGLICFSLGVCCGCIVTSLCCSSRLRRLLVAVLVEGYTAIDRPIR
jgi:hypothetical protein